MRLAMMITVITTGDTYFHMILKYMFGRSPSMNWMSSSNLEVAKHEYPFK